MNESKVNIVRIKAKKVCKVNQTWKILLSKFKKISERVMKIEPRKNKRSQILSKEKNISKKKLKEWRVSLMLAAGNSIDHF